MSIDSMRVGGGRCPPLLVGGLVIACIMMVCNWWTLSSTNLELLRQIEDLNDQIKISVEERDQCATDRGNVEKQLRMSQDEGRTVQVKLSQVEDALSTCVQELQSFKQLETTRLGTLEALRVDKKEMTKKLQSKKEENNKLQEELNKVKEELENVKHSMIAQEKTVQNVENVQNAPNVPIAINAKIKKPNLGPVEKSAVEISVKGTKGLLNHGIPVLPKNQPDAVRLQPRFSVTQLKTRLLEKPQGDNRTAINAANPQVNAPPNAGNLESPVQEPQEKDTSNKDDTAAEVNDANGNNALDQDLNLNLPDTRI